MTEKQQPEKDPCDFCRYKQQACAYWIDGQKPDGACITKLRSLPRVPKTGALTLTPAIATHYQQRSQDTGNTVSALVLADLTALHRKRVAREEKRVWKDNEYERL
jgi:hypothetical protein